MNIFAFSPKCTHRVHVILRINRDYSLKKRYTTDISNCEVLSFLCSAKLMLNIFCFDKLYVLAS
jgi:hypothetical protein